jgi:hypothetical protein
MPSQLYLAIASIFSFSVCKVKEFLKPNRPYINVRIGPSIAAALYHLGADISCISEKHFRKIPVDICTNKIPQQKIDPCFSAGGGQLSVKGVVNLPVDILGKETMHPFRVIQGLNKNIILGADFINKHLLVYDPKFKQVKWRKNNVWSVSSIKMTHETVIPEYSSKLVKVNLDSGTEKTEQVVAEITCAAEPYLVGGPGLINVDTTGCSLVEVFNAGPEPVNLSRCQDVGQADNVEGQSLFPFEADQVNQIAEQQWKETRKPAVNVRPDFYQMCNLKVPSEYKERYCALLSKHKNIFSLSKSDLGFCDTVLHKLFMKTEEPIDIKQFKIPEAHQNYLQDQVREWLKLGIIQPSRSRYNSPVFLVQKKDGTHRVVQDFRSLNANTYVDKYSMKDVQECILEIGRAGSTIFTTLDLTSRFWQMALDPKLRPYTAFTVPGMGQFEWKVVSMGLASAPSAFQRLVELVVKGIDNVVVYIDDLIIHSQMHEQQTKVKNL